jgi:hypothetical protein
VKRVRRRAIGAVRGSRALPRAIHGDDTCPEEREASLGAEVGEVERLEQLTITEFPVLRDLRDRENATG